MYEKAFKLTKDDIEYTGIMNNPGCLLDKVFVLFVSTHLHGGWCQHHWQQEQCWDSLHGMEQWLLFNAIKANQKNVLFLRRKSLRKVGKSARSFLASLLVLGDNLWIINHEWFWCDLSGLASKPPVISQETSNVVIVPPQQSVARSYFTWGRACSIGGIL